MKYAARLFLLAFLLPMFSYTSRAQQSSRIYVNAGYITNLSKCDECTQKDRGGSVRVGLLGKGKFGFYAGYLWFTEYHEDFIEYDDAGSGIVAGID